MNLDFYSDKMVVFLYKSFSYCVKIFYLGNLVEVDILWFALKVKNETRRKILY